MIRVVNRLLVLILGFALLVGGLLVIIEGAWNWTNSGFVVLPGSQWLKSFETTPWSDKSTILWSLAGAVVGLILVLLEIRPHRKRVVSFSTDTSGKWQLLRRSTEAHLQRRLEAQVPTSPIRARLKPGARRWSLRLTARAASSSRPTLEAAGRKELAALHAPGSSRVQVTTTGKDKQQS